MTPRFGNAQHIGARQQQQDSFGFSDLNDESFFGHAGFLAVIADGMGGLAHGDAASRTAVRGFLQSYGSKTEAESIPQALERAVRAANLDVNTLATGLNQSGEMGTTLVAAAMRGDELFWVSCGDSAIYLLRDGELTLLNTQHVYARILDERAARGEISNEQALGDPQREALTSHLGQTEMAEIDVSAHPFTLQPGDTLLLASDGLFKTLPERDIAALVGDGAGVQAACERLVATVLARQRRGQDNVTVVALGYADPIAAAPPVRELARESPGAQQTATQATVEAGLAAAAPPPKAKPWKIFVPALIFVVLVAAAGIYSWTCCAAPPLSPADAVDKPNGSQNFDLKKLPPSKTEAEGAEHPQQEFEPLEPGAVEATKPPAPTAAPAPKKKP